MFFLILLVLLLIITCLVSEKYREPENIYHLSNAVSETQISSIPYLQFQKANLCVPNTMSCDIHMMGK